MKNSEAIDHITRLYTDGQKAVDQADDLKAKADALAQWGRAALDLHAAIKLDLDGEGPPRLADAGERARIKLEEHGEFRPPTSDAVSIPVRKTRADKGMKRGAISVPNPSGLTPEFKAAIDAALSIGPRPLSYLSATLHCDAGTVESMLAESHDYAYWITASGVVWGTLKQLHGEACRRITQIELLTPDNVSSTLKCAPMAARRALECK